MTQAPDETTARITELPPSRVAGEGRFPEALHRSAMEGIKWATLSQVARAVLRLVTTALLARLLPVSDFGLVGMAWVVIVFAGLFRDLGGSAAVIQRKALHDDLPSSAFWVNVIASAILTLVLFAAAPAIAGWYGDARVAPVLQALSLLFLISGSGMMHQALLERHLAFGRIAGAELAATLAGCACGITGALWGLGVWSLVTQELVICTVATLLLWVQSPWRPQRRFNLALVREVRKFSLNVTGFHFIEYFTANSPTLLIGRFLGAHSLGFFTLANNVMLYPVVNVANVLQRVFFPVYAQLQDDDAHLRTAYLDTVGTIAFLTVPLMLGLMAVAEPFVHTLFGLSREEAIPLVLILAPVGLLQSLSVTVAPLYLAKGRADWLMAWSLLSGALLIGGILAGIPWGLTGVAIAYAVAHALLFYPAFAIPFRLVRLTFKEFLAVLRPPLLSGGLMAGAIVAIGLTLPSSLSGPLKLALLVGTGIVTYLLATSALNRDRLHWLWHLLRRPA